jgi:hypothetical protein
MEFGEYLLHNLTSEVGQVHQSPPKAASGESYPCRAPLELGDYVIEGEQVGDGAKEEGVAACWVLPEGRAALME